jgi:cytochrome oxidase assembly protein ShyY1
MARRPRWVATLVACVALAVGFALLAQWQVSRAVIEATVEKVDSETIVPIESILTPMTPQQMSDGGRRVSFDGSIAGDTVIIGEKPFDGVDGQWVVTNVMVDGSCLPVVVGWAPAAANPSNPEASSAVTSWTGRLVPSDDILGDEYMSSVRTKLAASDLVNLWSCDSIFDGYVVSEKALNGLTAVDSQPPVPNSVLNWLNVFYALEWIAFGVFALYFWYRLVKDAVERELEDATETQP